MLYIFKTDTRPGDFIDFTDRSLYFKIGFKASTEGVKRFNEAASGNELVNFRFKVI